MLTVNATRRSVAPLRDDPQRYVELQFENRRPLTLPKTVDWLLKYATEIEFGEVGPAADWSALRNL